MELKEKIISMSQANIPRKRIKELLGTSDSYICQVLAGVDGDLNAKQYVRAAAERRGVSLVTLKAMILKTVLSERMIDAVLDDLEEVDEPVAKN